MKKQNLSIVIYVSLIISAISCSKPAKDTSQSKPPAPLEEFCDNIDYTDTTLLHDRGKMEWIMANIVKLLPYTDSINANNTLKKFFANISHDSLTIAAAFELGDLYLNNPASPARNETMYIRLLKAMTDTSGIPDYILLKAEDRLHKASLNRPGNKATNIEFLDRNGLRRSLYSIKAENTLLIFYDPECSHCNDILDNIRNDKGINKAIADNSLTVVAIYAEGKKDVWQQACSKMPQQWIVGYDLSDILENELYDLPAMPIIYILDRDKTVVLKDPDVRTILSQ